MFETFRSINVGERVTFLTFLKSLAEFLRKEKVIRHDGVYVANSLLPPMPSRAFTRYLTYPETGSPFSDLMDHKRKSPVTSFLKILDRCPYNCSYCSAKFGGDKGELSTLQWINIIAELQSMGVVYIGITGGEPMLREDLEEIIASANDRSTVVVFSNGAGLTLERAKALKKAGLFGMSISLDHPDEKTNNDIRGSENAFSTALAAISNSRKAGLFTTMQSVIFREGLNRENMRELFRLAKKHGAHESRIHQPAPAGVLLDNQNPACSCFSDEEKRKLYEIQDEANRKFFGFPRVSSFVFTEGPEKFGCSAGVYHSFITEKGEMTPCDFIPMSFGNVLEERAAKVYARMRHYLSFPKESCLARRAAEGLKGKSLPTTPEESIAICQSMEPGSYGRLFEKLRPR